MKDKVARKVLAIFINDSYLKGELSDDVWEQMLDLLHEKKG